MNDEITLLGDKVIVEPVESSSTILVTDSAKWRYKVVTLGRGRKTEFGILMTPPVSIGDIVIVDPIAIARVDIKGKQRCIVNSNDIIARE